MIFVRVVDLDLDTECGGVSGPEYRRMVRAELDGHPYAWTCRGAEIR
jgi:hypothetical protein